MQSIEGQLRVDDARFCLIAARFNATIVDRLIDGAIDALREHGAEESSMELIRVPGAYELPLAAQHIAASRRFDGLVALGTVIRGETPHFDYVCGECASGLSRVSLDHKLPVGFGVLTCDNVEQALERSGTNAGNKGAEAALAALEMVTLLRRVQR